MNEFCVIWSREDNSLEISSMDALINFNGNRFLDDEPGRILLRCFQTEQQAKQFVHSYSPWLDERAHKKVKHFDRQATTQEQT